MHPFLLRAGATFTLIPLVLATTARGGVPRGETSQQRELHVVGLYEGVYKTKDKIHGGRATVTVKRPNKLVTLVLGAYSSVTWEVILDPKTKLEKVILAGHRRQAV